MNQTTYLPQWHWCFLLGALLLPLCMFSQVDARLLRYPDVSQTHITFVYANDIWIVPKSGGQAARLSSPEGEEQFPRFSPDGSQIAFTGNYDGNQDIYVIDAEGGLPQRLTFHGMPDRMLDWHPDGDRVLFASRRYSGKQRFNQFYAIPTSGGMPEQLPVPYGEFATFSPDGQQLAYTKQTRLFRTWKRYRGGAAADIHLFNLNDLSSSTIIQSIANEELPMWKDDRIYYMSDANTAQRYNLYVYDLNAKESRQLTEFTDFDVHFPSMGPEEIVFQAGDRLYLLDLESEATREVTIQVVTDRAALTPRTVNAAKNIQNATLSPSGKRLIVQARGELFSVPAKEGFVQNITQTSGAAERQPSYAPEGNELAYFSDADGEYDLYIRDLETGTTEKVTNFPSGYRYQPFWSPDGQKIAFINQAKEIQYVDRSTKEVTTVGSVKTFSHGGLLGYTMDWSPDSRWLAYIVEGDNLNNTIHLFDTESGASQELLASFYSNSQPVFDPKGEYLFFTTNRHFRPVYSDYTNMWSYPNGTQLAAIPLRQDVPSPLAPKNDEEEKKEEDKEENEDTEKEEEETEDKAIAIDFDGFEERMVVLPPEAGNYGRLAAAEGKLIYVHYPRSGSGRDQKPALMYFDLEERESKTIMNGVSNYRLSGDRKHLLVQQNGKWGVVKVAADQKLEEPAPTSNLEMVLDPQAEWRQIFADAWRFERDYFYDPNMHGVDWDAMRTRYGQLIESAGTREDVNFILGELIGELNASHTYRGGGDTENGERRNTGYLGIDWMVENEKYKVAKVVSGAPWDSEVRSPIQKANVDIREGDAILSVNGLSLRTDRSPYAPFAGLGGKTVALEVERDGETRTVIVELLSSETRLRNLAWIESNRRLVEEASDGRIGYIYVPSTGIDGQNELLRMFQGQWQKEALIIDERFNNGGQIPDRFIELLNRKPLAYWAIREGQNWQWPPSSHFGPKAMLINGWAGSGGDAFPDYFRKAGLGPLIGETTWGGLIGISGVPSLVDGGVVTVPTFRMYNPDGSWFDEGRGVAPDIEVDDDATELANGRDPQIERAVQVLLEQLEQQPNKAPEQPAYEVRVPSVGKG